MSNDTTQTPATPNTADKNAFVCIKQTALLVRETQKRRPRNLNGVKQAPKVVRDETKGTKIVPPCQFLVAPNRAILKNKATHLYLTQNASQLLTDLAHDLDLSGAVVDTKNKLLSTICNTKEFAVLAQKIASQMLALRGTTQNTTEKK
jgi:hypothetical protein